MLIAVVDPSLEDFARVAALLAAAEPPAELRQIADRSAFQALTAGPAPDLVLLADELGWADGLSVIGQLRAAWAGAPVIMLAGNGSEELAVAGMRAGLADYLPKARMERLPAAVRAARSPAPEPPVPDVRLRAALDQMPVILTAFDAEARPVFWNREAERVTGYRAEEVLGDAGLLRRLYPPETLSQVLAEWDRVGGNFRDWELELITKGGERRVVAWSNLSAQFPIAGWHTWSVGVDVTARREAEAALRSSEFRFRTITELISDFVYEVAIDPEGNRQVIWATDAVTRMLGYIPEQLRSGEVTSRLYHPDDMPIFFETIRAIEAGRDGTARLRMITRDGEVRWVHTLNRPIWDPAEGRVTRYLGALQDITEQKRAEQRRAFLVEAGAALGESLDLDATLRQITHLAVPFLADHASIRLLHPDGSHRPGAQAHISPEHAALQPELPLAFPDDDLPASHPAVLALRTGRPQLLAEVPDELLAAALRSDEERALLTHFGRPRSMIAVPLIARGRTVGIFGLVTSRSQRRYGPEDLELAEEFAGRAALAIDNARLLAELQTLVERSRAQAAELEAIFEHAPIGLALLEPRPPYRHLQHNRVKLAMHGERWLRRATLVGARLDELVGPEDAERLDARFTAMLQSGESFEVDEAPQVVEGEERPRHFSWSATPLRSNGDPTGILIVAVEITARKEAERQRLELERALQVAQKVEGLGILAGGVAHDFNNLLAVIQGNLDLTLELLPADATVAPHIRRAALATRRAADLTAQLLAIAGKGSLDARPIDLNALLPELAGLLHGSVPHSVDLRLSLATGLPPIWGDATQLRQVLMNLVINAGEAIGQGQGTITVSTEERWVDADELVRAQVGVNLPAGRYVVLRVADSGPGMDTSTLARVFDPFFSTKLTGRGLGLAAVHGIVRLHRGAIALESVPGHGAAFTIYLPTAPAAPAAASTDARAVLIVDDEPELRTLLGDVVGHLGLRALSAGDGAEALSVFRAHADAVACVILDLSMPRSDGATAFEALRALRPELPIVLMSGYSAQDTARRLAGATPTAFLPKPFAINDLLATLQRIVPTRDADRH